MENVDFKKMTKEEKEDYYADVITPLEEMNLCKEFLYVIIDSMCEELTYGVNGQSAYYDKRQVLFSHLAKIMFKKENKHES